MRFIALTILGIVCCSAASFTIGDISGEWKTKDIDQNEGAGQVTLHLHRKEDRLTGQITFTDRPALGSSFIEGKVVDFHPVFFGSTTPTCPHTRSQQITINGVHSIFTDELHLSWHYFDSANTGQALTETVGRVILEKVEIPKKPKVLLSFDEFKIIYNTKLATYPTDLAFLVIGFNEQWAKLKNKYDTNNALMRYAVIKDIMKCFEDVQVAFVYEMLKVMTSDEPDIFDAKSYFSHLSEAQQQLRVMLENAETSQKSKYVELLKKVADVYDWPLRTDFLYGITTLLTNKKDLESQCTRGKKDPMYDRLCSFSHSLFDVVHLHFKFIRRIDYHRENKLPWASAKDFDFPEKEDFPGLPAGLPRREQILYAGTPNPIKILDKGEFLIGYDQRVRQATWSLEHLQPGFDANPTVSQSDKRPDFKRDPDLDAAFAISSNQFEATFDKGHLVAAGNYKQMEPYKKTFVLSNAAPQNSKMNQGDWKTIEQRVREKVRRHTARLDLNKLGDKTTPVPSHFGKGILFQTKSDYVRFQVAYYLIENEDSSTVPWDKFKTTRKALQEHCGISVFENIKDTAMEQIHFSPPITRGATTTSPPASQASSP